MFEWPWDVIDPFLIRLAIVWSIMLLARRHLTPVWAIGGMLLVLLGGQYDPLYQAFMAFWPERNPQLSTFIYLALLLPLMALQLCLKKRRSVDRVIMTVALCAVATTTMIFHSSLVTGVMPAWQEQINYESRTMLMIDDSGLREACKSTQRTCGINSPIADLPTSEKIRKGLSAIERETQEQREQSFVAYSYAELNDIDSKDIAFITYYADTQRQRVLLANNEAEFVHRTVKQLFYFLATVAHASWLSLAMFLIYWHKRMITRGQNRAPVDHA